MIAALLLGAVSWLAPQRVLQRGDKSITPPRLIHSTDPVMPSHTFAGKKLIVVECTVNERGDVADAEVTTSAGKKFGNAALEAVRQYKFEPATKDGHPPAMKLSINLIMQYGGYR